MSITTISLFSNTNNSIYNDNSNDDCSYSSEIIGVIDQQTFRAVRLAAAVFGIILFSALIGIQGTYIGMHQNVRTLLLFHHFCVFAYSILCIGELIFELIFYSQPLSTNLCSYLLSTIVVVVVRSPSVLFAYMNIFGLLMMAVERSLATVYVQIYEHNRKFVRWRIVMMMVQILSSIVCILLTIVPLDYTQMRTSARLTSASTESLSSSASVFAGLFELIALIMFHVLLWYNYRLKHRILTSTITIKYQVNENIRALSLMLPLVWSHFICYFVPFELIPIYLWSFADNNYVSTSGFVVFTNALGLQVYYPLLLSIALFVRYFIRQRSLSKIQSSMLGHANNDTNGALIDGRTQEQIRHFQLLNQAWASHGRTTNQLRLR